jgi:hypothetical protein
MFHPAVAQNMQPVRQLTFFDDFYYNGKEVDERYGREAVSWKSGNLQPDMVKQETPVYLLPGAGDYQKACTGEL